MIPTAHARLIQIPMPRLAKKKLSGIEISADEDEDRRDRADADRDEALRHGRRHADADLAQDDEEHGGEPEEEHDLADRARVPADDGDRRAVALARVPAGQRREREQQPEEEREPPADAGELSGTGKPHAREASSRAVPSREAYDLVTTRTGSSRGRNLVLHEIPSVAYNLAWPSRAREPSLVEDEPPLDPDAVDRAVPAPPRTAGGAARSGIARSAGRAFASGSSSLLVARVAVVLAARTLGEIERVFGL